MPKTNIEVNVSAGEGPEFYTISTYYPASFQDFVDSECSKSFFGILTKMMHHDFNESGGTAGDFAYMSVIEQDDGFYIERIYRIDYHSDQDVFSIKEEQ